MVSENAKLLKAYHKRKAGLFKKVQELSTLCDVKACVIAYGPESTVPETWPPDRSTVVQIIGEYRDRTAKKRGANEEVGSSKKKRIHAPPSDKGLDGCSPEVLRQMMVELNERIGEARSWMQILKGGGGEEEKLNPQPMPVSQVPAAPMMSEWCPLLDQNQGQQPMYAADAGSCYYANGNSSNSLGFASEGFVNMQYYYTLVLGHRSRYIRRMGAGPQPLDRGGANGQRVREQIRKELKAETSRIQEVEQRMSQRDTESEARLAERKARLREREARMDQMEAEAEKRLSERETRMEKMEARILSLMKRMPKVNLTSTK